MAMILSSCQIHTHAILTTKHFHYDISLLEQTNFRKPAQCKYFKYLTKVQDFLKITTRMCCPQAAN